MAEQIISPGVFTRENDQSFLPQGIGQIGAAIVGPTVKGPAFVPTVVRSFAEYTRKFGGLSSDTFVPQTVREYLKNAGSVTVCRVLAGGGYTYSQANNQFAVIAVDNSTPSSSAAYGTSGSAVIVGVIFPSKATSKPDLSSTTMTGPSSSLIVGKNYAGRANEDFSITLNGTNASSTQFSASINPSSKDRYLFKQLGNSPNNSKNGVVTYSGTPGYTYNNWKTLQTNIQSSTVKESSTLTLFSGKMPTGSIGEMHANTAPSDVSGSMVITNGDGNSITLIFASSSVTTHVSTQTGSLVHLDSGYAGGLQAYIDANAAYVATAGGHISGSDLADLITGSLQSVSNSGISVSSTDNVVTITNNEAGTAPDIELKGFLNTGATTGSIATGTQGVDVTGYSGINADRYIILVTQSADMVYSGIGQTEGYGYASTPYITSGFSSGPGSESELFRVHTLMHGEKCNTDYKVSIANLKEPGDIDNVEQYSQFSVLIRGYKDKDKSPSILEQYNNCTLDPDSPRYISRMIGDRYPQYNDTLDKVELLGNFPNVSQYIRIEVNESVTGKAYSPKLSPKGFKAVTDPINTSILDSSYGTLVIPSASYTGIQSHSGSQYSPNAYLGWEFTDKSFDNYNWIKPLPNSAGTNVAGHFNVENYAGHASASLWSGSLSASIDTTGATGPTANQLKFSVPFQGGDDGIRPDIVRATGNESLTSFVTGYSTGANLYGFDLSGTDKAGYKGYKKALDILSNQDEYDINMVAVPGVIHSLHPLVTNYTIDMCENRGDTFFVMDGTTVDSSVNTAINDISGVDTNYAATYYPWVKVLDSAANKPIMVPPSVIVPGAIAASDRIAAEWFAPAGLNRGVLGNVLEAKIRLNQAERDRLYDEKINPIATFPQTGVCIWGQKTLQERSTALDRINVRRLMIALKKFIASSSRYLVFEQNTDTTRSRFLNIVNPYLESVQQKQGLYAFRVVMNESNNTPDVIDRNQLVGAIYLQPTKTAEFIILDFNVLPTGATFPA